MKNTEPTPEEFAALRAQIDQLRRARLRNELSMLMPQAHVDEWIEAAMTDEGTVSRLRDLLRPDLDFL